MNQSLVSRVTLLKDFEPVTLDESLAIQAGLMGLDPWMKFLHDYYSIPVFRLVARTGNILTGWLSLAHINHAVFGKYLATAPFGSYGGFAFSSGEARDLLLDAARKLMLDLGVDYVNVRSAPAAGVPPPGWIQHPIYATYLVDLAPDPERLMGTFSSDHRNHVRKSLKKGLVVKFGHLDLADDVYEVIARSMHELGSPYHSLKYLRSMAIALQDAAEFAVVYFNGSAVGGGVFLLQGNVVANLHANLLRDYRSEYAGEFLYWSAISRYGGQGLRTFDLGRSLIGSGNEAFKMKWKPRRVPLQYWYCMSNGGPIPELNQGSPRFRLAIWAWKHLPTAAVRALGPGLIRGIA